VNSWKIIFQGTINKMFFNGMGVFETELMMTIQIIKSCRIVGKNHKELCVYIEDAQICESFIILMSLSY
jgi:hypothetical protein